MFPSSAGAVLLFLSLLSLTASQPSYSICGSSGNFTGNGTYATNLRLLLAALATNGSASGFLRLAVGTAPDRVYGIGNCRGDASASACRLCLDTAAADAARVCPGNQAADLWYDLCLVCYSNRPLPASTSSNRQQVSLNNADDADEPARFNWLLGMLLNRTAEAASASASGRRFAIGQAGFYVTETPEIYAVFECTMDQSGEQCRRCLWSLFDPLPEAFVGKKGARLLGDTCSMRYELYAFFEGAPTVVITVPPPPVMEPTPALTSPGGGKKVGLVLAVVLPLIFINLLISIICIYYRRRRKQLCTSLYETDSEKMASVESLLFDLSTLKIATNDFSEDNKLGEGGFGVVYKGQLPNEHEIAVKKLLNSNQGFRELKNELVLVSQLQHRNLVKLLGVCLEGKMIVYEYFPNRSLDTFLFDPLKVEQLCWPTRYKIICGIARGLRYLHEESQLKIVHRDLKAGNILLDANMNPKISDFGLAKLFDNDKSQSSTTQVVGTFGYMSPEYAMRGQFSIKSDAFSFGVIVLEILTGRKNCGSYNSEIAEDLLSNIWEKWKGGQVLEMADPSLGGDYQEGEMLRCFQIGLLCVQEESTERPTMSTVVVMLNAETITLGFPSRPAICVAGDGKLLEGSSLTPNSSSVHVVDAEEGSMTTIL